MATKTAHLLLDRSILRTADVLLDQLTSADYSGCTAEIHLFEGLQMRHAMRAELMARGIHARVRSAYKPIVHFFLEDLDCSALLRVQIEYPRHPLSIQNRFLLEAYPLTELFPDIDIQFREGAETEPRSYYRIVLSYADRTEEHRVFAPNVVQPDFLGSLVYTPSAWLTVAALGGKALPAPIDEPVEAEYQQAHHAVMQAVTEHAWGKVEPYFERLTVTMHLPGAERDLRYGHEHVSTTEAMHEEIYFSLLEFFQSYGGRPRGDRGLQPGQIVPDIRLDNQGAPRIRVSIKALVAPLAEAPEGHQAPVAPGEPVALEAPGAPEARPGLPGFMPEAFKLVDLSSVDRSLAANIVERVLRGIPGNGFEFRSRQGRAVRGVLHDGSLPAVVISAAQHANETSGVVGALRAAEQLKDRPNSHFVVIPIENPDGYAMHQELCVVNPEHMHHAARYTALGDDLEYRERAPWFERQARDHAFEISQAQLHLNLHGYPAHEWTRPCTGYLPRGFELWSIPKGFFLILRYKPAYEEIAAGLLEHVTRALAGNARLAAFNEQQLRVYRRYVAEVPFDIRQGVPCIIAAAPRQRPGITLITEFPDETICGDEFAFAHTVQMETVICATDWWWAHSASLTAEDRPSGTRPDGGR